LKVGFPWQIPVVDYVLSDHEPHEDHTSLADVKA